ncbi:Hypothetical protein D9617_28g065340 [Elsinoe fawcettii]|nr:Hypothetical protein D9617_28g065340 [Elsinoe fawcettii]
MSTQLERYFTDYKFELSYPILTTPTSNPEKSTTGTPQNEASVPLPASLRPKAHNVGFSFVNVVHPTRAQGTATKRVIRSHVARVQHSRVRISSTVSKKKLGLRTQGRVLQPRVPRELESISATSVLVPTDGHFSEDDRRRELTSTNAVKAIVHEGDKATFEHQHDSNADPHPVESLMKGIDDFNVDAESTGTVGEATTPVRTDKQIFLRLQSSDRLLMSSKSDPFWSYPVDYNPSYERALGWYVVNITVDIEYLTLPGQEGNLREHWIPLTMTDSAAFYVIVLMAATAYAGVNSKLSHTINLLALKGKAIAAINKALSDPRRKTSDATVAGILKLAAYEAAFGSEQLFHSHMDGLKQIIAMRGGLRNLGWDGLLERMVLWVDTNATRALGCGWKFEEDVSEPNAVKHPKHDPLHFARYVT